MNWVTLTILVLLSDWGITAIAQTNSWLHPSSGNWHDAHWSAGVLPGVDQTLLITNAGSKTVRISQGTLENYPETLNVGSITVSAPTNFLNTLLLDGVGFSAPLSLSRSLHVDQGGALVLLGSALRVNRFDVNGIVAHGALAELIGHGFGSFTIGDTGVYHLTNGMLKLGSLGVDGTNSSGIFNHYGGTNLCTSVGVIGTYNLTGGQLQILGTLGIGGNGSTVSFRPLHGTFNQSGGTVDAVVRLGRGGWGTYNLSGGLRTGGPMLVPDIGRLGGGRIYQTGGTNVGAIEMIPHIDMNGTAWSSSYTLSGGELRSPAVNMAAFASFEQRDGVHVNGTITLSSRFVCKRHQPGYPHYPDCKTHYGEYRLHGGTLLLGTILGSGICTQTGGRMSVDTNGVSTFYHNGGQLIVNDLAANWFHQSGGVLTVTNISVGVVFRDGPGTINHYGWTKLSGGSWFAREGERTLGPLVLLNRGESNTLSWVSFPTNASTLLFLQSARAAWSDQAGLVIRNWNGSLFGGGTHQLRFGKNINGLTVSQLGQIYFQDPGGVPGLYPARILADGEVVPRPVLALQKQGADLILNWPDGFILQTATNVHGPYQDVLRAFSPMTLRLTGPCRFFRLRLP